ncbi:histidine-type phosphatase [Nocardia jejuensis]|uniref:histidine-type phosphatase n=1 Tax=Nocardia jejuensis TaxID=328049 RepID=UPI0008306E78|nr:histidine-type phosphatase [Nocardia jejuensis]
MTRNQYDAAEIDRWLAGEHQDFIDGLAARLDLDAGLAEVFLADQAQEFSDGLAARLDLDAGLAQILPTTTDDEVALMGETPQEQTLAMLQEVPVQQRLQIRAIYAESFETLAHLGFSVTQTRVSGEAMIDQFSTKFGDLLRTARRLDKDLSVRSDSAERWIATAKRYIDAATETDQPHFDANSERASARAGSTEPSELEPTLVHAIQAMMHDGDRPRNSRTWWLGELQKFVEQAMNQPGARSQAPAVLNEVAAHLKACANTLNDFVGADLSEVELDGVPLAGLRWSSASTRWPHAWQERIEQDSIRVENEQDVFEIRYGTNVHQDVLT